MSLQERAAALEVRKRELAEKRLARSVEKILAQAGKEKEKIKTAKALIPDIAEQARRSNLESAKVNKLAESAKNYVRSHPKATITAGLVGLSGLIYKLYEGTSSAISMGETAKKVYDTFADIYNSTFGPQGDHSGMRPPSEIPTILNPNATVEEKVAAAINIAAKVTENQWDYPQIVEMMRKISQDINIGGFGAVQKSIYEALYSSILRKIEALKGNIETNLEPDDPEYMAYQRDSFVLNAYTTGTSRAQQLQQGPYYRAEQRGEKDRMTAQELVENDVNARKFVNERGSRGAIQTIPYGKAGVKPISKQKGRAKKVTKKRNF